MTRLENQSLDSQCVYAVIPVYNRILDTLKCIECLKKQNHRNITIIVVDGGSSDNTREMIHDQHPDVKLLVSEKTVWWAGATKIGIDWAINHGASRHDYILMLNNDTEFDNNLVKNLVETSNKYNAISGCVVVDSDDPSIIIDGGVTLKWCKYQFITVKKYPPDHRPKTDSDVLPGRGTLIPIPFILKAGNVDDLNFPHFIADYEFTYRLKHINNIQLVIDYRAVVKTKIDTDDNNEKGKFREEKIYSYFGRKSKKNLIDHIRFIKTHAPVRYRVYLIIYIYIKLILELIFTKRNNKRSSSIININSNTDL